MQKIPRSDYKIITVADTYIYLIDLDQGGRSVTNDAANVVKDMVRRFGGLNGKKIYYRDSMGNIDEIKTVNDKFAGFAPVRVKEKDLNYL